MAIQSAINSMLGTAGTVSALAQHLETAKEQAKLNKLNAKEKYLDEYKETNEAVKENVAEAERLENLRLNDDTIAGYRSNINDHKLRDATGKFASNIDIERAEARRAKVEALQEANRAEAAYIRTRLQIQDSRAKLLGVDKHSPDIQSLNTEQDKEMVRNFKEGGNR